MKTQCHVHSQIAALHFPAMHVTVCCFLYSPSFPIQSILRIVPLGNISSVFSLSSLTAVTLNLVSSSAPLTAVSLNLVSSSAGNRQEADNKAQNLFYVWSTYMGESMDTSLQYCVINRNYGQKHAQSPKRASNSEQPVGLLPSVSVIFRFVKGQVENAHHL